MAVLGPGPGPPGLKPTFLTDPSGMDEAVPHPKPVYAASSRHQYEESANRS